MQICRQGNGHYLDGLNNQDFFFEEGNLKMITDGCSEGKFSEVGTRLFAQAFSQLDTRLDLSHFEQNVEKAFMKACSVAGAKSGKDFETFVIDNMLFTIIACFELEDKFVVKFIGDGYIITINKHGLLSYIRLFYGKSPPYYSYNKLNTSEYPKPLEFKTFEFSKKDFKKVGIASDGLAPIADKQLTPSFDDFFLGKKTEYNPKGVINSNRTLFYDDVTILF